MSLDGTAVDGQLLADKSGHLVLDKGIRATFDYFLSMVGEKTLTEIRARLAAYMAQQLPKLAASQAAQLLDRYLAYKDAVARVAQGGDVAQVNALDGLANRLEALRLLRAKFFSQSEIQAFYGDDDAYDSYTIERLRVLQNKALAPHEKALQIAQLTQALPGEIRSGMTATDSYDNLQSITLDWRSRNGSEQELRMARMSLVGAEATERLERLDQQRAQWSERLNAYRQERDQIMGDVSLSGIQRQASLTRLRESRFADGELARVQSLDEEMKP